MGGFLLELSRVFSELSPDLFSYMADATPTARRLRDKATRPQA